MESSSASSGSSKRAKAPINITQVVSCLVDGCNSDLSQCREYHRRHKVCEIHSKSPKVIIGGWEQRFCQQCSRFHSLVEFDEGKRSCRKRLDGHNRRRRKTQSESMSRNTGTLLSNQQGSTLLSFGSSQIFPSAVVSPSWDGTAKAESDSVQCGTHASFNYINIHENIPRSLIRSCEESDQFRKLKIANPTPPQVSAHQLFLDPNSELGYSGNNKKVFNDGLIRVVDSDSALSLLSSTPAETREIGSSNMVQPDPVPSDHSLNYIFESQSVEDNPVVFDGSSASESHQQTLSFMWE